MRQYCLAAIEKQLAEDEEYQVMTDPRSSILGEYNTKPCNARGQRDRDHLFH